MRARKFAVLSIVAGCVAVAATAVAARRPVAHASLAPLAGTAACIADAHGDHVEEGCAFGNLLGGTSEIAMSPDGANLYAGAGDGLVALTRDSDTGGLRVSSCTSDDGTRGVTGTDGACADGDALRSVGTLVVSPDGNWIYAAAAASSSLDVFRRDSSTGALTQTSCIQDFVKEGRCGDGVAMAGARGLTISPDGQSLYLLAGDDVHQRFRNADETGAIAAFAPDGQGGVHEIGCVSENGSNGACADGYGLTTPTAAVVSPDGAQVYVVSGDALLTFTRDKQTGTLAESACLLSNAPSDGPCKRFGSMDATAIAISPDGKSLYIAGQGGLRAFDRAADGTLTNIGCIEATPDEAVGNSDDTTDTEAVARDGCDQIPDFSNIKRLVVSPDGRVVYATASLLNGYLLALKRNPDTGALSLSSCVGQHIDEPLAPACDQVGHLDAPDGVALTPDGGTIYVAATGSGAISAFKPGAAVQSRAARVRHGSVVLQVACPAVRRSPCTGAVRVTAAGIRRGGGRAAARSRFRIAPGRTARVRLVLSDELLRALRRHRTLRAGAVVVESGTHTRAVTRAVTLR